LLREIDHDRIARNAVDERRLGPTAQASRIGRLSLLYLHRLVQQLTRVFSDIGLPDEYTSWHEVSVAASVNSWKSPAASTSESLA
jgi:hypothetical protein